MLNDYRIIEVTGKELGKKTNYNDVYIVHKDYIPMIKEFIAHWEDYWNGIKGRGEPYQFFFNIENYVDVTNPACNLNDPLREFLENICEDLHGMYIRCNGAEAYEFDY